MKLLFKYVFTLVLVQCFFIGSAQKSKVKTAAKEYDNFSYIKTSDVLLKVAENGYQNKEVLQKLANSFYFNNNMKEASKWYGELIKLDGNAIDSENYFRYALALKGIKDYERSDAMMAKFNELNPSDLRAKRFSSKSDYKTEIEALTDEFMEIENLRTNSVYSDFGTAELNGNMIFASSRGGENNDIYEWNNQPFLDLYVAQKSGNGKFSGVSPLSSAINTKYHESSVALTQDEKTMYFTRNNFFKRRLGKDDTGISRLQMFRTTLNQKGEWDNITPIHFNSDQYSVAHPTINKDGTRLYFASDMEGTNGQSDIYVVDINADGSLGTPENLGTAINTEGHESFPFINTDGDLYYSTNGLPGLGGYDIFVSKELDNKLTISKATNFVVENVGKPINSNADDFAFYENVVTDEGFFSSNREGGKGDDDIYSFKRVRCDQTLNGIVKDTDTGALIPGATVVLFNDLDVELERQVVGADAAYTFNVACDKEYIVRVLKDDYSTDEKRVKTTRSKQPIDVALDIVRDRTRLDPCLDLAKALNIPLIYFDYDKYDINYSAEIDLQKILAVLNQYPTMSIDIRSHTDCRASYSYNQILSQNRANATRQYLINNGVSANRLSAAGYGESQLVNNCGCDTVDDTNCSEIEHQRNRRSEFVVTRLNGQNCNN